MKQNWYIKGLKKKCYSKQTELVMYWYSKLVAHWRNHFCRGCSIIPCSFPSNIEVLNEFTCINYSRLYCLTQTLNVSVSSQIQLPDNRIIEITRTRFKKNYILNNFANRICGPSESTNFSKSSHKWHDFKKNIDWT